MYKKGKNRQSRGPTKLIYITNSVRPVQSTTQSTTQRAINFSLFQTHPWRLLTFTPQPYRTGQTPKSSIAIRFPPGLFFTSTTAREKLPLATPVDPGASVSPGLTQSGCSTCTSLRLMALRLSTRMASTSPAGRRSKCLECGSSRVLAGVPNTPMSSSPFPSALLTFPTTRTSAAVT